MTIISGRKTNSTRRGREEKFETKDQIAEDKLKKPKKE